MGGQVALQLQLPPPRFADSPPPRTHHYSRQIFTLKDKDLLAQYLAKFPASERAKLGTFERAGAQLPGHTVVSWHEHYRKIPANTHDINCRIERILRQQRKAREDKKRRREQEKHGAQNEDGANGDKDATTEDEEEDQLASDSEGEVEPVASTSKARSAFPKPKPKARTSNASTRRNSPPSSDDDDDDDDKKDSSPDSDFEVQKGARGKRAAGRAKFTDDDFDLCVRMMADREKCGYSKTVLYTKLEEECPDHTFASWQSWISKHQHALDEALRRYQDRLRREKEKRRQQRREQDQDEDGVESRRESPVAGPSRAPPPQQQKQEEARANGKGKAKAAAALFAKSVIKAGSPRAAPALNSTRDSDDSGSVRPRPSRIDKGKGRALSPRRQRPSPSPLRPADPAAALAAPVVAEEIFTEEDKHILVHQFARGRIKGWETDNICLFLARQHPQHTQASWSAYWHQNVFELVPLIAARVEVIKQAQAAKRLRAAAAAAEADVGAVGDAEGTAAAAEEEEEQAERRAAAAAAAAAETAEADERIAREAEERFRLDEEEEAGARAGQEEERIGQEDDDDDGAVDAFADLPQPEAGPSVDDHPFDAPSPSPPPRPQVTQPSQTSAPAPRALAEQQRGDVALDSAGAATPVKPAENGAGLAAAVLTPRHTPPIGTEQQPKQSVEAAAALGETDGGDLEMAVIGNLEPEKLDETILRVAAETVLPSSQSTLPHHSQYSQMPSPFMRDVSPAAADDDDHESAGSTDSCFVEGEPKIEEDSDEDLELLVSRADPVKIPIDDDDDSGAIDEDQQMWNELAPAEHQVIQDLHAAVADIEHNLPHGPRRRASDGRPAPAPVPAQPQPQPQPPARQQQPVSVDKPSRVSAPVPGQSSASARLATPAQANNGARAQPSLAATAYVLNSPPPPKKRQREHSPTSSLDSDDHVGSQRAPAPKRQKLEPAPAPAPAQIGAAKSSARPRHSAPAGLRAFQHDSPAPTPGRRVPRASLAAVTQAASASPAPPPPPPPPQPQPAQNMQRAPDILAERLSTERSADAEQQQPSATKLEKPAVAGGLKLKELLALLARKYSVPQRAITNLIFCTCARCDPETLEDLVRWFAPMHRPLEGTPEYERLAGLVAKYVWTLREDTIALEGSEAAVAQLEAKRGKQAIKRRVLFLGRANIKNVTSLRKDLYNFRV
ncbi:hypothetical protein RHOSPDRAFT_31948 [Rhodotorula sp. JG-1b]|nr:hypothetical protein RHOSPDRAFT_31948 [Rhodotorula sp. JG-1b]